MSRTSPKARLRPTASDSSSPFWAKHRTAVAAAVASLSAVSMVPRAMAQAAEAPAQAASATTQTKPEGLNTVVVTGTSIRGIAPTGASVDVMNAAAIKSTGATTSTELMRSIPELGSFNSTGNNVGSNQANFVDQPAIHGVGVGNGGGGLTLILLDGHRLPGAGINQTAPDAGAIPTSALERVEVMADGGSAIYGSDAIAGVINFVSRRPFDGAETGLNIGSANGYRSKTFSQLLGKTWDGGGALFDYQYTANTALNGTSRNYITNDQTPWGGTDTRSTTCSPANVRVGSQNFMLSASGAPSAGTGKCDSNVANDLYPAQQRHQVYLKATQDLSDSVTVYGSLLYSGRDVQDHVAGGGVTSGAFSVNVASSSPYYIQMPGTATGAAQSVTYNPSADFGPTFTNTISTKTTSAVVGADIDLTHNWSGKVEFNHGLERDDVRERGINQAGIQSAVTAGQFNPYGIGAANSPAMLASLGDYVTRYFGRQTVDDLTMKADGPLAKLSTGTVRAAFGFEHRRETFFGETETGEVGSAYTSAPYSTIGRRTSNSEFAELFVPIVGGDMSFPGVRKLELSAAVRHDSYSDVGGTTNPKIGANWTVVDGAIVRLSAGRSFHAPSLADAGTAIDTRVIHFACIPGAFVGCLSAAPSDYSVIIAGGNSSLKPETAKTYNLGVDLTPALTNTGFSASLSYFRIDYDNVITFPTFGPVTNPIAAYDKYRTVRPAGSTDAEWLATIQPMLAGFRHDGQVYPDIPTLPLAVYDLRRQNFANEFIRGFDYRLGYKLDTSLGMFHADLAGTHLTRFDQVVPGVANPIVLLGTDYAVKDKARAQLAWVRGDLAGSVALNYTGSYSNTGVTPKQSVGSFRTLDTHWAWTLPASVTTGAQLSLDISNLTNARPPAFYTAGNNGIIGYDPTVSSAIGRMFSIGLHKTW